MYSVFILLLYAACDSYGYGYDSGSMQGACGKPLRTSRMHKPPCDLAKETYCTTAGSSYPWHAVKRFIRENQGLMRRMYGDERHVAVLRAELDESQMEDDELYNFKSRYSRQSDLDNEVFEEKEIDDGEEEEEDEERARYFEEHKEEIILNTKFVYSQDPSIAIRLKDLQPPRFRPTTQKAAEERTETTTTPKLVNKTVEVTFENATEVFFEADDGGNTTENETDRTTTVEDVESTTTTEFVQQETTTETLKKISTGEVLFQDLEHNNNKVNPSNHHANYNKLRGVNACPVKEEIVAPFWANNTRGEVLALLNIYPFEQYVHWEKCTFEHRQMYCREGCRCEQQYRLHRLLAYDPNDGCRGIFSDWFKFPSCCVCKCYDMPAEFRVTSRSPRSRDEKPEPPPPGWYKKMKRKKTKSINKNKH